jgi:hypothetical protein
VVAVESEVFQAHQKQVIQVGQVEVAIVVVQGVQQLQVKEMQVQPQLLVQFCRVVAVEQVQQVKVGQHHNQHQYNIQEQTEGRVKHPQLLALL